MFRAQKVHATPILILERGRRKKKNGGKTLDGKLTERCEL